MSENRELNQTSSSISVAKPEGGVWALYRKSLKPNDSSFNLYFARPLAAPLVYLFARTRFTPNQVTFLSTGVMLIALVCLASISGQVGLVLAMIGIELSYILDCVDGQLARVTGRSSEVGGELDFMMDELKAYALIVALGLRGTFLEGNWLGLPSGSSAPLLVSLGALICTASAITLTRFIRSEGFAKATGRAPQKHGQAAGEGRTGGPLWPIKMIARFVTQYPASIPLFAMAGRLDLFLYTYAGFHALYTAQSVLVILIKLGRFAPRSTPQSCSEDEEKR